ncbi:PREDICTED: E3 ubiquitin-protein ligase RNF31-like isoform X1 [Poecilia mexicana]|uniref:E3 ubiquitin-protein ligase RNF31-like isoform X1 n=1 Tax=Poecilia mexicana TaxID=48701 RepID=UPI00072E1FCA|nr:PREDICTED: E3 ubiquitin-protein ligase RNF31-like isoform X1 [Poecilia mexicana]
MPLVGPEAEQQTLTECRYRYPTETLKDLQSVRARFRDLRLFVDFYCFPNKETRRLLHLSGTLPVFYQGSAYNIPVCVWLHQTHPLSRPRCVVCPSVAMVINPSCPHVDSSGTVSVDGLRNWTPGVSNLTLLLSEMRLAFQKDTPLYARSVAQAPPPAGVSPSPSSQQPQNPAHGPAHLAEASQWEQDSVRTSYTEELKGIDFGAPPSSGGANPFLSSSPPGSDLDPSGADPARPAAAPPTEPLSRMMGALRLDGGRWSEQNQRGSGDQSPAAEADLRKVSAHLSPDRAAVFMALITMTGRSFSIDDVIEAVQHNPDLPSALKFLTHICPICRDQVSFSKIITMTHCSCFLCQSCFTSCFSIAIKERAIHQLTCPQCGQPEIRGQGALEESMDYFNLLDTQIRHFLPPDIHELFQRKLRDRALQEMPRFCWCAHCSFGMLHESDRLRMDCPSCRKSTCSQCRSPWSPHHQGLSCAEFKAWQQQTQQDWDSSMWVYKTIECPSCQFVFSLSRGGCLHFTCSQCRHQFCGGCSQRFALGPACSFSAQCASRGLHAHHPRDCLYHLRDWSVARLHRLLQHYRVTPSWLEPSSGSLAQCGQTVACFVLELRDDSGMTKEEPCGRPAPYGGYCQAHYKERLVEQINRCGADPAVLFSPAEVIAELRRWSVVVPTRMPEEPEPLYAHRLRLVLTNCLPLMKQRSTPSVTSAEAPPTPPVHSPTKQMMADNLKQVKGNQ